LHYLIKVERNNKNVVYGAEQVEGRNKKEITTKGQETENI